jgi:hypothetical protein
LPVRRPTVSITTHQGAIPASRRFTGLMIRHATIIAERLSRCRLVISRFSDRIRMMGRLVA